MNTKKLKKIIIKALPYVLVGLVCTNLGEAWRLAEGADASKKLLSIFSTLGVAFGNPLPSFHPVDLLVGAICGGALYLAVYIRHMNAKHFKFGKGLAEPFQSKDGREFMRITIPNQDPADKTPWASFVLPAKAVHENQYGKGLWAKIPADGTTVVTKPTLMGRDEAGKNIWQDVKNQVPNRDLKAMVESYKTREPQAKEGQHRASARDELNALVKDTAAKVAADKPKAKTKSKKGPEL